MTNLVQLAELAKNLPADSLFKAVNGQGGELPPYLALTEIQRRKTAEEQYKGMQAAKKPHTTVAEDLTSTQPQPGMAPMQPGQAPPQGFAAGGVVKGYASGGGVPDYIGMSRRAREAAAEAPTLGDMVGLTDLHAWIDSKGRRDSLSPAEQAAAAPQGLAGMAPSYAGTGEFRGMGAEDFAAPAPRRDPKWGTSYGSPYSAMPFPERELKSKAAPTGEEGKQRPLEKPPVLNGAPAAAEAKATQALAIGAQAAGEDPMDSLAEMLANSYSGLGGDLEDARLNAQLQAGLAIMSGTSPFALENIGKGAQQGLGMFMQAKDEITNRKGDLEGRQMDLAMNKEDQAFKREQFGWQKEMDTRRMAMQEKELAISQAV